MIYIKISKSYRRKCLSFILAFGILHNDCAKFVTAPAPISTLNSGNVYTNDATAISAMTSIYTNLSSSNNSGIISGLTSISLFAGLSADELTLYDINNSTFYPYYFDALTNENAPPFWSEIYGIIFVSNSVIEGLNISTGLTPSVKQQLLGEAEFVRAYCYFYLVNLYGDVPLALTSDYKINAILFRTSQTQVWNQIIADLKSAQGLLSANYLDATLLNSTNQRIRPTSWAASAMLARAYLYTQKWDSAALEANDVINNGALYMLDTLNGVFLANSNEAIWQLQSVETGVNSNTGEGAIFVLPTAGPNTSGSFPVYLSNNLVSSFETGDQRRVDWVDSVVVGTTTYYYPFKYKIGLVNSSPTESSTILRLGEQYLIRAEAEAEGAGGGLPAAINDLNVIRNRANLSNLSNTLSQSQVLDTILHERRVELFTEWGHRWLDLKRTSTINSIMGTPANACQVKGGVWNSDWQWYPLPFSDLKLDHNLSQNAGYL